LLAERAHSENARSIRAVKGNLDHSLEQIFGAEEEMEADDLLCSCNARPPKTLVGHAQGKINHPPSLEEITSELGEIICNIAQRPQSN
jgi:hypothetical protein